MDKVEIIVVDSASTDQTVDFVEAWRLQKAGQKEVEVEAWIYNFEKDFVRQPFILFE